MTTAVLGFAVVSGLLTMVPGLDTALVVRASISNGRTAAYATLLGISAGVLAWGVAAAAGVSALLSASEVAYRTVRLAGAAYLLWMGAQLLWQSRSGVSHTQGDVAEVPVGPNRAAFQRGLLTNLLNPKVGVFYMAMLPQFMPPGANVLAMGALLASVHVLEGVAWYSLLIWGSNRMRSKLERPTVRAWTDRITGATLTALGLKVALER